MKIALITEAWPPQVNGVVTTWGWMIRELEQRGHTFMVIHPGLFRSVPAPRYPDVPIALFPSRKVRRMLDEFAPDAIHIATEGPIGRAARKYCLAHALPFTTSYHSQFPEYFKRYFRMPLAWSYPIFRQFHAPAVATLAPTESMIERLVERNFEHVELWSRGVDSDMFRPRDKAFLDLPRPIFVCAGRVALEKNLPAFLKLELPGTKVVIGKGPALKSLRKRFPKVVFKGFLETEEMAKHVAAADVSVFPSVTDTFGLVMLEAMASGVPIAAFPVTGPKDVVEHGVTGILDQDLAAAATAALDLNPEDCRRHALTRPWSRSVDQLAKHLAWISQPTTANDSLEDSESAGQTVAIAQASCADPGAPSHRER